MVLVVVLSTVTVVGEEEDEIVDNVVMSDVFTLTVSQRNASQTIEETRSLMATNKRAAVYGHSRTYSYRCRAEV